MSVLPAGIGTNVGGMTERFSGSPNSGSESELELRYFPKRMPCSLNSKGLQVGRSFGQGVHLRGAFIVLKESFSKEK